MQRGNARFLSDRPETFGFLLFGASIIASRMLLSYWQQQEKQDDDCSSKRATRLVRYLSRYSKWRSYSDNEEAFIQELPKVELHVHLDGSCDADFLWNFLQENPQAIEKFPVSIENPPWDTSKKELVVRTVVKACKNRREYHNICTCRGHRSLKQMMNCFQMFLPVLQGDLGLLEQLAYDFCQRQYQQNIVYTEVRYSPHLLADGDASPTRVIEAITSGLRRGCASTGIVVNQILCAISWRPEWAVQVVELAEAFQNSPCSVVGVDIAAGEEHFDRNSSYHKAHIEMANRARTKGIPMTLHAGEIPHSRPHIHQAVKEYHCQRIGHGYRMIEDDETVDLIRKNGVHVEACLTSSVETGGWMYQGETRCWPKHPARSMLDSGVSLSLNSDDPAVFHTSLAWQYRVALAKMNTTKKELIQTNFDAIDAAFCSSETKKQIQKLLVAFADEQGIPGFEVERSEHGVSPEERQTLLKQVEPQVFTDRVYLNNAEYT